MESKVSMEPRWLPVISFSSGHPLPGAGNHHVQVQPGLVELDCHSRRAISAGVAALETSATLTHLAV